MQTLPPEPAVKAAELLLVEDNYGDVILAQEAFRMAGLTNPMRVAADGEEALGMLRRRGPHAKEPLPDLILLDMNLPCMDGREVLREIRADPELRAIPVIVMTRTPAEADHLRREGLDVEGYSAKPLSPERLKTAIAGMECFGLAFVVRTAPHTQEEPAP